MYLDTVLKEIKRAKRVNAEHLYKLNEAVFNLPEEDEVDPRLTKVLFDTVSQIFEAYKVGKINDSDKNFFYDWVALLGTLQNQYFFNSKQTESILGWIAQVSGGGKTNAKATPAVDKAEQRKLESLQKDNERLKAELEKFKEVQDAVKVLQSFKPPAAAPKAKAKAKAKTKAKAKDKAKSKEKVEGEKSEDEKPDDEKVEKGEEDGEAAK